MRKILPKLFSTVLVFNALAGLAFLGTEKRARIFKLLWSPRTYSKEPIPPGCVYAAVGRFDNPISFYPVPSPQRLF
jgi:hypothetical protein